MTNHQISFHIRNVPARSPVEVSGADVPEPPRMGTPALAAVSVEAGIFACPRNRLHSIQAQGSNLFMPRTQRSEQARAYRQWYKTARWRKLRKNQLAKQPFCRMCTEDGRKTLATVADHIKPHRGIEALFFSPRNLQSLCTEHHDRAKQSEERLGYSKAIGLDGWPTDERHPGNR